MNQSYMRSSIFGNNANIRTSDVINDDDTGVRRVDDMDVQVAPEIDIDMQSFNSVHPSSTYPSRFNSSSKLLMDIPNL